MSRRKDGLNLSAAEIRATFESSEWATRFPPVLSTQQAADLLQVPLDTIYDWSSRGLLQGCSRRVGKHLRFFRERLLTTIFNQGLNSGE